MSAPEMSESAPAKRGAPVAGVVPGEIVYGDGPVALFESPTVEVVVTNGADRPIQVGSHFHFAESNEGLLFDRAAAWGMRLAIPAGTAVRFEPGIERRVQLVALRGRRQVHGLRGLAGGPLDREPGGQP